jgi:hypothetical protein
VDGWWRCRENKWGLTPFISSLLLLFALPAFAYDVNELKLGASEKEVLKRFPGAHCRPLEWPTNAADRRCDDSRIKVANLEGSVTFYLLRDAVEGFDLRFEKDVLPAMGKHFLDRYGKPVIQNKEDIVYEWKAGDEHARLTSEKGRRRASLFVWRGTFETEIYRVK